MQNFSKGENLWNHIPDKAEVPAEMDPKYEEWDWDMGKMNC